MSAFLVNFNIKNNLSNFHSKNTYSHTPYANSSEDTAFDMIFHISRLTTALNLEFSESQTWEM